MNSAVKKRRYKDERTTFLTVEFKNKIDLVQKNY